MREPVRLRMTLTWTIEANPDWHEPGLSPDEMAAVEQSQEDLGAVLDVGLGQDDFKFTVTVEPK